MKKLFILLLMSCMLIGSYGQRPKKEHAEITFLDSVKFKSGVIFDHSPADLSAHQVLFNDSTHAEDTLWTSVLDLSGYNSASVSFTYSVSDTTNTRFTAFSSANDTTYAPFPCDSLYALNGKCHFFISSKTQNFWKWRINTTIENVGLIQSWAIKQNPIGTFKSY